MKKTILILLCGWFAIMATRAQCAAQNEAIQAGEELVYDLKFNWKFIWVAAGQAKMDMQAITYQGKPCFRSNLISVSNRQVDFFFKMRDTLTCITSSRLCCFLYRIWPALSGCPLCWLCRSRPQRDAYSGQRQSCPTCHRE